MIAFITININVLIILAIGILSFAIGYWVNSVKKNKIEQKIRHLESEMLNSHAEILRLSKEMAEKALVENKTLVVPIHEIPTKKARENRPSQ
jgi:hypothetical protein